MSDTPTPFSKCCFPLPAQNSSSSVLLNQFPGLASLCHPQEAVAFAREAVDSIPCSDPCLSQNTGALFCPRCCLLELFDDLLEAIS